nr:phospholipase A1-Igamma2, chloroplastic-like [Tanacetum cinerariifolium]
MPQLCSSFYYCPTVGALENERILLEQWTYFTYCRFVSNKVEKGRSLYADGTRELKSHERISNDKTTACLGRRDISLAWRGTVTNLEWMEDLMDFLKPVSTQNLTNQDPNIKVMAGFLHIYTDKDQRCEYSNFSVHEQVLPFS